jgi:hypothetical protein
MFRKIQPILPQPHRHSFSIPEPFPCIHTLLNVKMKMGWKGKSDGLIGTLKERQERKMDAL